MKAFSVHLLSSAKEDLLSLHNYVVVNDSREKADELFDEIQTRRSKLKTLPHRGRVLPELKRIGIAHEFRELIFKPYRIIYSVIVLRGQKFLCTVSSMAEDIFRI